MKKLIKNYHLQNKITEYPKTTIDFYKIGRCIGRGAFGEVLVCREFKTGKIYAVKKIKKDVLLKKNQIIHIRSEQQFMYKFQQQK